MDVKICPLSRELADDYFDFFDNVAFCDHEEWSWCYCTYYHFDSEIEKELDGVDKNGLREYAVKLVKEGIINGYLAYIDGKVAGWCNAGDKAGYKRLRANKDLWSDADDAKVKSVVCFIIAPKMRNQGIATLLLKRVCEDAASEGFSCVEAYPACGTLDCYMNFHGYISMYEKSGFVLHKRFDDYCIMQKNIVI
ncbi:MAG: GNAT family N-acetyltransferase [Clostridiales bacterium]|nr:GNAT family N-acetyltransferase [Clostridiales bacterium]